MATKNLRLGEHKMICGRVLSENHCHFSDRHFDSILKMENPQYKVELSQVEHLCTWLPPAGLYFSVLREAFAEEVGLGKV